VASQKKDNQRWIDYANEREAAVEEYVRIVKRNRMLKNPLLGVQSISAEPTQPHSIVATVVQGLVEAEP
jgi:hypothetical protein